ncbi:N-acetylmuramoyl-L-alanine amidase [Paenibacillus sp. MSJ-34]|uniref:N-acetylmuramoyl-L-alanine amidase n=1 Tax=Paenibacillus sp. MSJ-34 TaxID=2841529 RepID=UPI001C10B38A|nr:N-acetylmuramoyl-L-alanine amidase [Paenibacillus sp. MSJ-34]MBU5444332.1 N-acetylmuramoyl-L-alanine amidase [Paenibacillus sp. MSJ-34]
MKIVLDAGHGPETPGKRAPDGSLREYQFNAAVARYTSELLAQYEGVETMFTFEDSRDVPLKERTNSANAWKADLFVSIHANAFGSGGWNDARGIETYVYTTKPAASVALANEVHRQLVKQTGLYDRGVKTANFHVLRESNMPAILVECGFMTNRQEAELLKSDAFRRHCANAIADGIVARYSLQRKSGTKPDTKPSPDADSSIKIYVNDQPISDGYLIESTVYVPARSMAEALGYNVEWDNATKTVRITKQN